MRNKIHSIIFYCLVALICVLLLSWYKTAKDDIIRILLFPHAKLTEIYYNLSFVYVNGIGYSFMDGAFAIGRACMGSNFIVMMFAMNACLFAKHFEGTGKLIWLVASLFGSIVAGVFISCVRIIGSVPFVANPKFALFHSSIGISLYFLALTASYAILKKLIRGEINEESI
jgi:exosortase K